MKVVINVCFGGFGLSHAACKRYAELSGFSLFAFSNKRDNKDRLVHNEFVSVSDRQAEKEFLVNYSKSPLNPDGSYTRDDYWSDSRIERNDPNLVRVVEEMGDSANGQCAKLRVVEIPDGIEYEIDEYDGNESIDEKHRSWR